MNIRAISYILFSEKLNRFYVGATTENIEDRISKHNSAAYGQHRYTSTTDDWCLFLSIEVEDYPHAIRIERKIKSMKSSNYIRNLKKYPELVEKLKETTKSI